MMYMDHAATSWPKPKQVGEAMVSFMETSGGNPGRSGHALSIRAGCVVYDTRELVAEFFGVGDPMRVIFAPNVTFALNLAMLGLLKSGDRVVTTSVEHNSVMRPLRALEADGLELEVMACGADGLLDLSVAEQAITPGTRLVVLNHASNVMGAITPVAEVVEMAHRAGALVLLDAAQTAGALPIDMGALGVDLLGFTGHKGLLGPTGTGGLILGEQFDPEQLQPLLRGGTGSNSEYEQQPEMLPDRFESGTGNSVGLAGLYAGLSYVMAQGVAEIRQHEAQMTRLLLDGLAAIPGVTVYGPEDAEKRTCVISLTAEHLPASEIGFRLDDEFGIMCRVGLHCAPSAHKTIGTFPDGTVRLAAGYSNTEQEIEWVVDAVGEIVTT